MFHDSIIQQSDRKILVSRFKLCHLSVVDLATYMTWLSQYKTFITNLKQ